MRFEALINGYKRVYCLTPCSLAEIFQCFRDTCCLYPHGREKGSTLL